jgi:hypothetical protein
VDIGASFALFSRVSTATRRSEMAVKAKKTAKLHKGKKLEARKPLKAAHGDFSITKLADSSSPK